MVAGNKPGDLFLLFNRQYAAVIDPAVTSIEQQTPDGTFRKEVIKRVADALIR